ncbi:hypothetical protein PanWU01x14_089930 [Parasponia andersonii]|uniref:Uncharacterized protein n=1 Tax=Parasponia andersonii TaxID=3476 RepID=A0A2P5D7J2_PARAD|nr:hypothetical protein PanWU01x14_089930 [Parasponia andersonii]
MALPMANGTSSISGDCGAKIVWPQTVDHKWWWHSTLLGKPLSELRRFFSVLVEKSRGREMQRSSGLKLSTTSGGGTRRC